MCTGEFMISINTAPLASNSMEYGREKWFWYNKIIFLNNVCHCSAGDKHSGLYMQMNRVPLPATLFYVSLYCFFFLFTLCTFPFWPLFFISLLTLLIMRTWINIYFKLKSGVLFCKRGFKSSWSAYWPSFNGQKKSDKLSRHVPPLKQRNFFQC